MLEYAGQPVLKALLHPKSLHAPLRSKPILKFADCDIAPKVINLRVRAKDCSAEILAAALFYFMRVCEFANKLTCMLMHETHREVEQ
jgi:hypothetical protein